MTQPALVCDVVVVGAGLAGALVARRLAEEHLTVAVMEATPTVGGTGGRGAGLALLGTPELYTTLVQRLGPAGAAEIWALTRQNLALLTATADKMGQKVRRVGSFRPVGSAAEADQLQRSAALLEKAGYAVTLDDATEQGFMVGLRTEDDLAFDPTALAQALLAHPGIVLHREAEVQEINPHPGAPSRLDVWARKQYLWTERVVLAGGAHVVHLSHSLGQQIIPLLMRSVDCPAPEPLTVPLVLEGGQVTLQQVADHWRLVAWSNNTDHHDGSMELLARVATQFCPQARILARTSGWTTLTPDRRPVVGELSDLPGVYTVSGLGPWGLSWLFVAVEQLAELLLHQRQPTGLLDLARFAA